MSHLIKLVDIKEVQNYKNALYFGFNLVKERGFLSVNYIKEIQSILEQNDAGFRKQRSRGLLCA